MNKNYDLAVGAKRLEKVTPSLIRTILDRASVLRSEGKPVIPFSAGEPDFNTPSDIKEAAIRAITNNQSKYTSNRGYGHIRKKNIQVHLTQVAGGKNLQFPVYPDKILDNFRKKSRFLLCH